MNAITSRLQTIALCEHNDYSLAAWAKRPFSFFADLGLGGPDCRLHCIEQIAFCARFFDNDAVASCLFSLRRFGRFLLIFADRNRFPDLVFQEVQTLD